MVAWHQRERWSVGRSVHGRSVKIHWKYSKGSLRSQQYWILKIIQMNLNNATKYRVIEMIYTIINLPHYCIPGCRIPIWSMATSLNSYHFCWWQYLVEASATLSAIVDKSMDRDFGGRQQLLIALDLRFASTSIMPSQRTERCLNDSLLACKITTET